MNIIVCCDGTWNTPNDLENGVPSPTNVVKLYNAWHLRIRTVRHRSPTIIQA